jgi:hypothetical protein
MSVITSFNGSKQSGPDQYAPPDRRSPKKLSEVDQAARGGRGGYPEATAPAG